MANWRGEKGAGPSRPNGGAEEGIGRAGSPKLGRLLGAGGRAREAQNLCEGSGRPHYPLSSAEEGGAGERDGAAGEVSPFAGR